LLETSVESAVELARAEIPMPTAAAVVPQSVEGPAAPELPTSALQPQRVAASAAASTPTTTSVATSARSGRSVARQAPVVGLAAMPASGTSDGSGGALGGGAGKGGGSGTGIGSARGSGTGGGGGSPGAIVDSYPRKGLSNLPPVYPTDALLAGVEGRVVLRVRVTNEGRVEDLAVERSANWPSLDEAALTAVRQWRFLPARRDGIAIAFDVLVPVRFSIRNP
jgi:protein TonB